MASKPQTDEPHAKRLRTTAAAASPSSEMPERLRGATDIKELFPKYLEVYAPDGGSVRRGLAYYLAGAVVMWRELPDRRVEFQVLGQHEDSYQVVFDFGPNYKRAECLCARQTSASRHQRGWCKHIIACLATVVCDSVTAPEWVRRMPGANEVIALVSFDFIARCNNYARAEESPPTKVSTQQQQPSVTSTAVEEHMPSCTAVVEEVALSPEGYTSAGPLELFPIMKLYSPRIGPSPQCVWNIVKACVKKGAVAILDEGTQRCGLTESGCAAALEAVDSDRQRRSREDVPMPVVLAPLLSPAREVLVRPASAPALFPTSSAPLPSFATPSPLSSTSAASPHRIASPPAAQSYPASLFAVSGAAGATHPALPAVDSMETTTEQPNSDHMETCHFVSTCTTPSAGDPVFTSTSISTAEIPIPMVGHTSGDPGTSTSTSSGAAPVSEASPYREARRAVVSAEEFKRDWEVILITDSAEAEGITKRVWEHFTERQEYLRERGIAIDRRSLALGDYIWVARMRQHPYGMPSDPGDDIVLDWIMERKTIRDLRASLHDMRLDDQYLRLKSSRLNTVFLIEQPFTTNSELTRESFDAIVDFFLMEIESQPRGRGNLFVEHVLSQDETAAYVWRMTKRLRRHYDQHGLDGTEYSFRAFQKDFKKGNFRQSELGTLASMLLCVPGMSHTEAIAIARANPTPTGLVHTLRHFEQQQQQQQALEALTS